MYSANNPIVFKDDNGKILDVVIDVGFIVYDIYDITATVVSGEEVTATQYAALGADLAGAAIPFATGGGVAVRATSKIASKADNVVNSTLKFTVTTSTKKNSKLLKYAKESFKNKELSKEANHLVEEFTKGNTNPGIGTRALGNGLYELRGRLGARVYFKYTGKNSIDILGYSNKDLQKKVIAEINKL